MKKEMLIHDVEFEKIDPYHVRVLMDGKDYGSIDYDFGRDVWILWPREKNDGTTYFPSLKETESQIGFELRIEE